MNLLEVAPVPPDKPTGEGSDDKRTEGEHAPLIVDGQAHEPHGFSHVDNADCAGFHGNDAYMLPDVALVAAGQV